MEARIANALDAQAAIDVEQSIAKLDHLFSSSIQYNATIIATICHIADSSAEKEFKQVRLAQTAEMLAISIRGKLKLGALERLK